MRRVIGSAVAAMAVVLVGGCGGGSQPKPAPGSTQPDSFKAGSLVYDYGGEFQGMAGPYLYLSVHSGYVMRTTSGEPVPWENDDPAIKIQRIIPAPDALYAVGAAGSKPASGLAAAIPGTQVLARLNPADGAVMWSTPVADRNDVVGAVAGSVVLMHGGYDEQIAGEAYNSIEVLGSGGQKRLSIALPPLKSGFYDGYSFGFLASNAIGVSSVPRLDCGEGACNRPDPPTTWYEYSLASGRLIRSAKDDLAPPDPIFGNGDRLQQSGEAGGGNAAAIERIRPDGSVAWKLDNVKARVIGISDQLVAAQGSSGDIVILDAATGQHVGSPITTEGTDLDGCIDGAGGAPLSEMFLAPNRLLLGCDNGNDTLLAAV